jgi:hypothetical protein
VAWNVAADSLSLREFLGLSEREGVPDHSWLSRTRSRLPLEVHNQVFTWFLDRLAVHGLIKGEPSGVDASTMEADAGVITTFAASVLEAFIREADTRPPHCAVDGLLTMAQRVERDQGGRLTELQVRVFAAFLLGASKLPPDATDPVVVPEWLSPEDAERFAAASCGRVG